MNLNEALERALESVRPQIVERLQIAAWGSHPCRSRFTGDLTRLTHGGQPPRHAAK